MAAPYTLSPRETPRVPRRGARRLGMVKTMEVQIESLVLAVGKQVQDFAKRIDKEGITDTAELNAFSKLCNTYNRLLESAGQSKKDNGKNDEEEVEAIFHKDDDEFWREYKAGKFAHLPSNVTHHRCLIMKDPKHEKPKLYIPLRLRRSSDVG